MKFTEKSTVSGISTNPSSVGSAIDSVMAIDSVVQAGAAATLTSGAGGTSGVIAFPSSAVFTALGLELGEEISIFWDGGARHNVGYTGVWSALDVSGGTGNNFPVNGTALTVGKLEQTIVNILSTRLLQSAGGHVTWLPIQFQFTSPDGNGPVAFRFADASGGQNGTTPWTTLEADQIFDPLRDQEEADFETLFADFLTGTPPEDVGYLQWANGYTTAGSVKFAAG